MNRRRLPRAAAVVIRTTSEQVSYAEVLRKAKEMVSLGELGIDSAKI